MSIDDSAALFNNTFFWDDTVSEIWAIEGVDRYRGVAKLELVDNIVLNLFGCCCS